MGEMRSPPFAGNVFSNLFCRSLQLPERSRSYLDYSHCHGLSNYPPSWVITFSLLTSCSAVRVVGELEGDVVYDHSLVGGVCGDDPHCRVDVALPVLGELVPVVVETQGPSAR